MKPLHTTPGKVYSVHTTTGCTVSDDSGWSKEIDAPEGYFTAHGSKVYISDEAATVRELFKLAPIAFGGGGKPGWYDVLRSELAALLGEDNFSLTYAWVDDKFTLTVALVLEIADEQLAQVRVLLGSIPPQNLVAEIDEMPLGFTRLAYLESTGTQNVLIPYTITYSTGLYLKGQLSSAVTETGIKFPFSKAKSNFPNTGLSLFAPAWSNNNLWLYEWGRYIGDAPVLSGIDYSLFEAWNNWDSLRFVKMRNCRTLNIYSRTNSNSWVWGAENEDNFEATAQDFNLFNNSKFRIYSASIRQDFNEVTRNFIPALNPSGVPCMFDTVTRKPIVNSGTGAFIAGVENQAQLNNLLRKLPDRTGQEVGTLQVRLADDLQTPDNEAKLDAMLAKNWEISQAA